MYILSPVTYCQRLTMTVIAKGPRHVHVFIHNKFRAFDTWRCPTTSTCTHVRLKEISSLISKGLFATLLKKDKRERHVGQKLTVLRYFAQITSKLTKLGAKAATHTNPPEDSSLVWITWRPDNRRYI
jgi:hypothetical protein